MSTLNVSNISDGTTSVGTGYVVNGSAKAWARYDGSSSLISSFNVSSLVDDATAGNTTVSFTSNMASIDYLGVASANQSTGDIGDRFAAVSNFFVGSVDTFAFDGAARADVMTSVAVMGDLA